MRVTLNGVQHDVVADTLLALVGEVPPGHAVALNGQVVPRALLAEQRLCEHDVVELVTAVAGG